MKERRSQRINVAARVRTLALNLLQRCVVRGVAINTCGRRHGGQLACRSFSETEIEQHDLSARGELQILRLDVAMNDLRILSMQIVERVAQLIGPTRHVRFSE